MTKEELKEKLKEISEQLLTVIETLDDCCVHQGFCENCPIDMGEQGCCLTKSQSIYKDLTTLLKGKKK